MSKINPDTERKIVEGIHQLNEIRNNMHVLLKLSISEPWIDHDGSTLYRVKALTAPRKHVTQIMDGMCILALEAPCEHMRESFFEFKINQSSSELSNTLRSFADLLDGLE